jgi:hypothetical protein
MTVKLSGQQKTRITARAQAAGMSMPRMLAEATLADGEPTTSEWNNITTGILSARQAAAGYDGSDWPHHDGLFWPRPSMVVAAGMVVSA